MHAQNIRAANVNQDGRYAEFLLEVGEGRLQTYPEISSAAVQLSQEILAPSTWDRSTLSTWVFEDVAAVGLELASAKPPILKEKLESISLRAVLAPKNVVVDGFNAQLLSSFPSEDIIEYTSTDRIGAGLDEDYANYPVEFLNSLELPGLPPHTLRISLGAVVILMRNLNSNLGLCNVFALLWLDCRPRCLDVLISSGKCGGKRHFIPRIPMSSQQGALPFPLVRRQFPVKLAWAMSTTPLH